MSSAPVVAREQARCPGLGGHQRLADQAVPPQCVRPALVAANSRQAVSKLDTHRSGASRCFARSALLQRHSREALRTSPRRSTCAAHQRSLCCEASCTQRAPCTGRELPPGCERSAQAPHPHATPTPHDAPLVRRSARNVVATAERPPPSAGARIAAAPIGANSRQAVSVLGAPRPQPSGQPELPEPRADRAGQALMQPRQFRNSSALPALSHERLIFLCAPRKIRSRPRRPRRFNCRLGTSLVRLPARRLPVTFVRNHREHGSSETHAILFSSVLPDWCSQPGGCSHRGVSVAPNRPSAVRGAAPAPAGHRTGDGETSPRRRRLREQRREVPGPRHGRGKR
jgi:hypothetical protein